MSCRNSSDLLSSIDSGLPLTINFRQTLLKFDLVGVNMYSYFHVEWDGKRKIVLLEWLPLEKAFLLHIVKSDSNLTILKEANYSLVDFAIYLK